MCVRSSSVFSFSPFASFAFLFPLSFCLLFLAVCTRTHWTSIWLTRDRRTYLHTFSSAFFPERFCSGERDDEREGDACNWVQLAGQSRLHRVLEGHPCSDWHPYASMTRSRTFIRNCDIKDTKIRWNVRRIISFIILNGWYLIGSLCNYENLKIRNIVLCVISDRSRLIWFLWFKRRFKSEI